MRRAHVSILLALVFSACASPAPQTTTLSPAQTNLITRIDQGLVKATRYMTAAQSPDGAWRSATYGFMKDGTSLTPHLVSCLFFLPDNDAAGKSLGARESFNRGADYLVRVVNSDGRLPEDLVLIYPVYTAAEASRMIPKAGTSERHLRARDAWLQTLRGHQLNESLGWQKSDIEYGGWGYSLQPARKPAAGKPRGPWDWPNLSATLYGIAALRSAKVPPTDPSYAQALTFIERCQNFSADPAAADPAFDDGGFYFSAATDLQNKAGSGTDRFGKKRFRSYGSMTADGLRGLLACGLPPTHPRVVAARKWLEQHFQADHNPGAFNPTHEDLRDATYYYYCWSVAHAFLRLEQRELNTTRGKVDWREQLAETLLARQRDDGTWTNRFTDAREDDPLVSTPFAAATLAICKQSLTNTPTPNCPTPKR